MLEEGEYGREGRGCIMTDYLEIRYTVHKTGTKLQPFGLSFCQ